MYFCYDNVFIFLKFYKNIIKKFLFAFYSRKIFAKEYKICFVQNFLNIIIIITCIVGYFHFVI
jgi:hypothetical protein